MSAPDRAAVLAAFRRVLDVLEAHPDIEVPYLQAPGFGGDSVKFYLYGATANRKLADLEAALGPFEHATEKDKWVATASLDGGVRVRIEVKAELIADYKVVGVIEKRDWTRRPVEPQPAAEGVAAKEPPGSGGN